MSKLYTKKELIEMGLDQIQINAVLATQSANTSEEHLDGEQTIISESNSLSHDNVVQMHQHNVEVHASVPLVPTSITQIATYKSGAVVELPPFADGQPFIARVTRPSLPVLIKKGKIPNSLLNQATSLFANGASALNTNGKNATNLSELFDIIDAIVDAALLEPTLSEIRSVGMELTDDQLMAIFSYTQKGIKALECFRTE